MRRQHVSDSRNLSDGQVTIDELLDVIDQVVEDAASIYYQARWASKDVARGRDPDDLFDIEDPEDLQSFTLVASFARDDSLTLRLSRDGASLLWTGPLAADRARRVAQKWNRLPGRAPIELLNAWTLAVVHGTLAFAASGIVVFSFFIVDNVPLWPLLVVAAFDLLLLPLYFNVGPYLALRVRQPVILERPSRWWTDPRFLIPTLLALIATVAGVVSAFVDINSLG